MSDHRNAAELFTIAFVKFVEDNEIKDFFNTSTQKMETSPGVEALIKQAKAVFPERLGLEGTKDLTEDEVTEAIEASEGAVVDRRDEFSRKVQANGGVRKMLRALFEGEPDAHAKVAEFFEAEDGKKF